MAGFEWHDWITFPLAVISIGYLAWNNLPSWNSKTEFEIPERNLTVVYQTPATNGEIRKCDDAKHYVFLVEAQTDPSKILANYLDCNGDGIFGKGDEYKDFFRCLRVKASEIKSMAHPLCDHYGNPSDIDLGQITQDAARQYHSLMLTIGK